MSREKLSPIRLEGFQPLREMVFDVLLEAIMSGQLPPGERLMEVQLADEMGVSRTPVREAIRRLELEGFVVMIPRKGAYVAGLSIQDVASIFEIRTALESLAVQLAAEKITEENLDTLERLLAEFAKNCEEGDVERYTELDIQFHQSLYKFSRNDRLVQMMSNLTEQINRYRRVCLSDAMIRQHTIIEHRNIIEALYAHDTKQAEKAMREHMSHTETAGCETSSLPFYPGT